MPSLFSMPPDFEAMTPDERLAYAEATTIRTVALQYAANVFYGTGDAVGMLVLAKDIAAWMREANKRCEDLEAAKRGTVTALRPVN